uniref:Uncharacterized protein n=1 Tax=Rhizophora mucronata TaxID=61149 RepID=A0A2P2P2V0_RHIMU
MTCPFKYFDQTKQEMLSGCKKGLFMMQ